MDDDELFGYDSTDHRTNFDKRDAADSKDALLDFYRARCDAFHQERKDLLERFHELDVSRESWHRTQWQNQVHKQEVELARVKDALHAAEETIAVLRAEQDSFKVQEAEDRKRIQHLLHLTHPTSEEVTFFKDCRPGHSLRSPVGAQPHDAVGTHHRSNVSLSEESGFHRAMHQNDKMKRLKRHAATCSTNGGGKVVSSPPSSHEVMIVQCRGESSARCTCLANKQIRCSFESKYSLSSSTSTESSRTTEFK
ncbi:hypothetical protein DYB30_010438 [Aphanomyces astaci]|uniref:Uncharacterized protein n=1 Tax=Aphanomyces astaci TaxID=112090 RepID=A0A397E857_APHAT|nr:hypothetical protein DYB30_010438 [Aphanomyces astaci]RHZ09157.1 hypothetical protein DYB26_011652 [Aphanomyces astaci]